MHYSGDPASRVTPSSHHTAPRQMNITARSSKDDVITAALELTDGQAQRIRELEQRQTVLWVVVGLLAVGCLF